MKIWIFTRCDYCGTLALVTFGWHQVEEKDYCCQACVDRKTTVVRSNDINN